MKIAIVKLSALGDIIHTAFILQFIKKRVPNSKIDWIVEERFASILEQNPDIDSIKTISLKSIKENFFNIFKEIGKLREYKKSQYDIVIDFQGLIKSAVVSRVLSKNVVGFDRDSIRESLASYLYSKTVSIPYSENTIDRYRVLASEALGIDISKEEVLNKDPYLYFKSRPLKKIDVIFIIGSTWQSRIYPKEKLVEVANRLKADISIPYADEIERGSAEFIASKCKNVTILPKMGIDELKAIISSANLLIGNDTGPSYIAWANNIPSITLFGPTPPTRIYETEINKLLKSPSPVDPYRLDKDDFSISQIEVEKIVDIAATLLKGR